MVSAEDVRASRAGYVCTMSARTRDGLLAGAFLVESQLEVALLVGYDTPHAGLAALMLAMQAVGLGVRRVAPLACVVLTMVPWAVLQSLGHGVGDNIYSVFFVMLFCL